MTSQIELEFKNMLTEKEFNECLAYFHIQSKDFNLQTNYYFDTKDLQLIQHRISIRVRELNDTYELTFKQQLENGVLEINQCIQSDDFHQFKENHSFPHGSVKNELLKRNLLKEFICLGSLSTKRAELKYKDGLLAFDHSYYLSKNDFEIEYEVLNWDEGKAIFNNLLKMLNIPIRKADSKMKRFIDYKKQVDRGELP